MADPATIGAIGTIIISVLSIFGGYLLKMHIKKCNCFKINCVCQDDEPKINRSISSSNNSTTI